MQDQTNAQPGAPGHFLLCARANGALEIYQLPDVMLVARFEDIHEGLNLVPSMDGLKAGIVASQVCPNCF